MIAKMPTIVAWAYKYSVGQPFVYPRNSLDYASNFLNMCFSVPAEDYVVDPILSRAMDRIFTLHADHEQNASTSTVRLASSSGRQPLRLHRRRRRLPLGAGAWRRQRGLPADAARDRHASTASPSSSPAPRTRTIPFRLMGFGHRVYKNFDPRAKVMKQTADEVLGLLGIENNPTLQVAKELERIALEDDYFIEKKLYPNVDFYSGIILDAIGFPTSMFTPIFALARTVGWISQWKEMLEDPQLKIGRPRQLYTGADPARLRGCREPLSADERLARPGARRRRAPRPRDRAGPARGGHPHRRRRGARLRLRRRSDRQVDRLPRGRRRDRHVLFLTAGGSRVDPGQGRARSPARRSRRPTPPSIRAHTGFAIGGVSPLGHLTPIETWFDPKLLDFERDLGGRRHPAPRLRRRPAAPRRRRSAPPVADFTA